MVTVKLCDQTGHNSGAGALPAILGGSNQWISAGESLSESNQTPGDVLSYRRDQQRMWTFFWAGTCKIWGIGCGCLRVPPHFIVVSTVTDEATRNRVSLERRNGGRAKTLVLKCENGGHSIVVNRSHYCRICRILDLMFGNRDRPSGCARDGHRSTLCCNVSPGARFATCAAFSKTAKPSLRQPLQTTCRTGCLLRQLRSNP